MLEWKGVVLLVASFLPGIRVIVHGVGVAWGFLYDIIRGWIAGKWLSRAIWGMRDCVQEERVYCTRASCITVE